MFFKLILGSLLVFFSLTLSAQQLKPERTSVEQTTKEQDSLNAIPVLSMNDLRQATNYLQNILLAKDWLQITKALDEVYIRKFNEMFKKKEQKPTESPYKKKP